MRSFAVLLALVALAAASPVPSDSDSSDDIALAARAPHPAVLTSPVEGEVLVKGEMMDVVFMDGETPLTSVSVLLRNATSSYPLSNSSLPFTSYHLSTSLPVPSDLSPGAYDFVILEGDAENDGLLLGGVEAVSVAVRVVEGLVLQSRDGAGGQDDHPNGISAPAAGATLTPGSSFTLTFYDGETTADTIQVVLSSSSGTSYTLGTAPFSEYAASASFTVPSDAASGSYTLTVQENASYDETDFTNATSETVTVGSGGASSSYSSSSSYYSSPAATSTYSSSYAPSSTYSSYYSSSSSSYYSASPSSSYYASPSSSASYSSYSSYSSYASYSSSDSDPNGVVTVSSTTVVSASSSVTSSSSSSSSAAMSTVYSTVTPSASAAADSTSGASSAKGVGAAGSLVGAVLGGLVAVLML